MRDVRISLLFMFPIFLFSSFNVFSHTECESKMAELRTAHDAYNRANAEVQSVALKIIIHKLSMGVSQPQPAPGPIEQNVEQTDKLEELNQAYEEAVDRRDIEETTRDEKQQAYDTCMSTKVSGCKICIKHHVALPSDPCIGALCWCKKSECNCPQRRYYEIPPCCRTDDCTDSDDSFQLPPLQL